MIHEIQKTILRKLWKNKILRYSDLARDYYPFENVYYHITKLIDEGLIEKHDREYKLTAKGAKLIPTFSGKDLRDVEYKIPLVTLVCKFQDKVLIRTYHREDKNREVFYGLPTFKAVAGERLDIQVERYLKNEFQIKGESTYLATQQYMEYSENGQLLFDDLLICFQISVASQNVSSGDYLWFESKKVTDLGKLHSTITDFVINKPPTFSIRIVKEDYIL